MACLDLTDCLYSSSNVSYPSSTYLSINSSPVSTSSTYHQCSTPQSSSLSDPVSSGSVNVSGNTIPICSPSHPQSTTKDLNIFYFNVRTLPMLFETWLSHDILDSAVALSNYCSFRLDCNRYGEGILTL